MTKQEIHKIFDIKRDDFVASALEIFHFQARENPVYRSYLEELRIKTGDISSLEQIPFLPIGFFKTHIVQTTGFETAMYFESSGTTGSVNSRHYIKDPALYESSFIKNFESVYGPLSECCILGLLPSYLERGHSSLVYMVDRFIHLSGNPRSGFYLHDHEQLMNVIEEQERNKSKTLLIGVTYALLDLAEKHSLDLKNTMIMETGGMKGRRKEMIRAEVHEILQNAFGVPQIHSEYGMTELLSQAYSVSEGIFQCPPWMKVMVRDEEDPFLLDTKGTGILNIIDLANIYSSSFIATDDAGRLNSDGSFEVIGRIDNSDIRGCSLLVI